MEGTQRVDTQGVEYCEFANISRTKFKGFMTKLQSVLSINNLWMVGTKVVVKPTLLLLQWMVDLVGFDGTHFEGRQEIIPFHQKLFDTHWIVLFKSQLEQTIL
jgi:hypothetical protein